MAIRTLNLTKKISDDVVLGHPSTTLPLKLKVGMNRNTEVWKESPTKHVANKPLLHRRTQHILVMTNGPKDPLHHHEILPKKKEKKKEKEKNKEDLA